MGLVYAAGAISAVFVVGVTVLVLFKGCQGHFSMRGLLRDKEAGAFSVARLQLLITTVGGAIYYMVGVFGHLGGTGFDPMACMESTANCWPPVPEHLLWR